MAKKNTLHNFLLNCVGKGEKESNVLRKVASLTYDMAIEQKQTGRLGRAPPDKYDLKSMDHFEGEK